MRKDSKEAPDKRKILLIEDDFLIAMNHIKQLQQFGYQVETESNPQKAILKGREGNCDLILMDIDLGQVDMDGIDVALEILSIRDVPIIFLSSHTEVKLVSKTERITSYGYVVKNSGITVLDASIKMAFKLYKAQQQIQHQRRSLLVNREKYRSLYMNLPVPYHCTDESGVLIEVNPAWLKLTGYRRHEIIGRNLQGFIHSEDINAVSLVFGKNRDSSFVPIQVFRLQNASGKYISVEVENCFHERFLNGEEQTFCIIKDITRELEEKRRLRNSIFRFRKIFESIIQAAFILTLQDNSELVIEDINAAALSSLKREAMACLGKPIASVFSPEFGNFIEEFARTSMEDQIARNQSIPPDLLRTTTWSQVSTYPVSDSAVAVFLTPGPGSAADMSVFQRIIELSPIGYMMIEPDGQILTTNSAYRQIIGYSLRQISTMHIQNIDPDFTSKVTKLQIQRTVKRGPIRFPTKHRNSQGEDIPVIITVAFIDDSLHPYYACHIQIDDKRLSTGKSDTDFLEDVDEAVMVFGYDGEIRFANAPAERMFGATGEELTGRSSCAMLMEESHRKEWDVILQKVLDGETWSGQFPLKPEHLKPFSALVKLHLHIKGSEPAILATFQKLHDEQHHAPPMDPGHYLELELYEKIQQEPYIFNFIQTNALDGLWYWDMENPEHEWINTRFWEVLGYAPGDKPHAPEAWQEIINPDDMTLVQDNLQRHLRDPDFPFDQIVRYRHQNGSDRWIRCRGFALRDENGTATRLICIHLDLTDQITEQLKYRQYLSSMEDMFFVIDRQGRHIEMYGTLINTLPIPANQVIGKVATEIMGEVEGNYHYSYHMRALAGESVLYEWKSVHRKEETWYQTRMSPVKDKTGEIVAALGISRDVSKLHRTIEQLNDTAHHTSSILNNISGAIFEIISDMDGNIAIDYASAGFYRILNLPESGATDLGSRFTASLHPEEFEGILNTLTSSETRYWEGEYRLRFDDSVRWVKIEGTLEETPQPVFRWFCYIDDITEQVTARKRRSYEEQRWEFAVKSSNEGLWDWNAISNEVYFSPQWKFMLGYEKSEISNRVEEWEQRIHPDDHDEVMNKLQQHLGGDSDYYESEHRLRCKDGSYVWILDRGKVVDFDSSGQPMRVIGTHTDITRQKQNELQLSKLLEEKNTLIKEIHHRIKNNFTNIESLMHLEITDDMDPAVASAIENSLLRIASMRMVYNKLLLDEGGSTIYSDEYLGDLSEEIINALGHHNIELRTDLEHVPLPAGRTFTIGAIVTEVLTNCMKYAFQAAQAGWIQLKFYEQDGFSRLEIRDSGQGLPGDFSVETQGNLGLKLITALSEQLQGKYSLQNHPDGGTITCVTFPSASNPST